MAPMATRQESETAVKEDLALVMREVIATARKKR